MNPELKENLIKLIILSFAFKAGLPVGLSLDLAENYSEISEQLKADRAGWGINGK